jgi:preprotein translocase subunit SecE
MARKFDLIEILTVSSCLLFTIAISLYHLSHEGYLGLTEKQWGVVWAISEEGLTLTLCTVIFLFATGFIKWFFGGLLVYLGIKIIYHISCFSSIYLFSKEIWIDLWSIVLVFLLIFSLFYCLYLIKKRHA